MRAGQGHAMLSIGSMRDDTAARFTAIFARSAREVRLARAMRRVIWGVAFGIAGAGVMSLAGWLLGATRLGLGVAAAGVAAGAVAGLLDAIRRRWSDADVALYLDARLDGNEVVTTALELSRRPSAEPSLVIANAARLLAAARGSGRVHPRWLVRGQAIGLLGVALTASTLLVPPRPRPEAASPLRAPATDAPGLERVERLERISPRDAAQAERLTRIAQEARELRAALRDGAEARDALARLARLRDDIVTERLGLGTEGERGGQEAAIAALESDATMRPAAQALEDGDLVGFDEAMRRLALDAEESSRRAAREALGRARRAAAEHGARALGDALEEQQRLFDARSERGRALRELADTLSTPEGKRRLEERLRALARAPASDAAERERAMAEAERGIDETERALRGLPVPVTEPGNGSGSGAPGSDRDEGTGEHEGVTERVPAKGLSARAEARLDANGPLLGAAPGRVSAAAGAESQTPTASDLRAAGPRELSGVEQSDVPTEYRRQIGRYFAP